MRPDCADTPNRIDAAVIKAVVIVVAVIDAAVINAVVIVAAVGVEDSTLY